MASGGVQRFKFVGTALLLAAVAVTAIVALVHTETGTRSAPGAAAMMAPASTPATTPPSPEPGVSSSPVAQAVPEPASSATRAKPSVTPSGPLTYTVKPGDNLTVIARWFKLHGYGALYERNRRVIGSDPDLIVPGQRITISPAGVTTSR